MRLSLQRLRWSLIAGAVLLVAVLAVYIGYGRYRALKAYRSILAHSGISLTHDSNGVTWSQSMKDRKLYTVRAKTERSLGDGRYGLHDAELLLYTRSEDHPDRIYGSEMEYDENDGILRAKGDVFMEIQPPQALATGGRSSSSATGPPRSVPGRSGARSGPVIHVRTSGLVYVRKLGVASTSQEVDFSYGSMRCRALGAEFNSDQSTVRLLANVRMDGAVHGQPLHIVATSADMDRNTNIAVITHPLATSGDRAAKADTAVLHLRGDGSLERIEGTDHVILSAGTQKVTANRLEATLTAASVLKTGKLLGDVLLTDSDAMQPAHGSAQTVDALFDSQGAPSTVTASGSAKLTRIDRRSGPVASTRSMEGDRITAQLVRGRRRSSSVLRQIRATGSARATSESPAAPPGNSQGYKAKASSPPVKKMLVAAEDLKVLFTVDAEGRAQPQLLFGTRRTVLQQDAPLGEQEFSSGDTLEMAFSQEAKGTGGGTGGGKDGGKGGSKGGGKGGWDIASAVQTGNVVLRDRAARSSATGGSAAGSGDLSTGSADRAAYDGAAQRLTLTGNVHLYGKNASLLAPSVRINQSTQDAEASGGVQTAFADGPPDRTHAAQSDRGTGGSSAAASGPVTHILSASARFVHDAQTATFLGTDDRPAFLWREGSQVKAATLFFNGARHTFSASQNRSGDLVHAVFASAPAPSQRASSAAPPGMIHVASPQMNYDDLNHVAVFSGGVVIDGTMGDVRGRQAVLFLLPPAKAPPSPDQGEQGGAMLQSPSDPLNGSIDRVVVDGSVRLTQPGRSATGEQLLYTAATQSYLLTGAPNAPPRVVDAQQGSVTGKTLLFTNGGSTIVAAGESGGGKGEGTRVRTETRVGPAKEERQ